VGNREGTLGNTDTRESPIGWRRIWPAPDADRLLSELTVVHNELDRREKRQTPSTGAGADDGTWLAEAKANLDAAARHHSERRYQAAWVELKAAQRSMIFDLSDKEGAASLAATLRQDALALDPGRRRSAMLDLLCDKDALRPSIESEPARIAKAAEVLDDYFDTQYYRIELRRRQLITLFCALCVALLVLVGLAYCGRIDLFLADDNTAVGTPNRLVAVILLGTLGAVLSIAQTIMASDLTSKITAQRVVSFMVWMRPAIGATAAVVAYVLLLANQKLQVLFNGQFGEDFTVIAVVAILAGFSERFITGALDRVAASQGDKKS